jgi:hypothetical protein
MGICDPIMETVMIKKQIHFKSCSSCLVSRNLLILASDLALGHRRLHPEQTYEREKCMTTADKLKLKVDLGFASLALFRFVLVLFELFDLLVDLEPNIK